MISGIRTGDSRKTFLVNDLPVADVMLHYQFSKRVRKWFHNGSRAAMESVKERTAVYAFFLDVEKCYEGGGEIMITSVVTKMEGNFQLISVGLPCS